MPVTGNSNDKTILMSALIKPSRKKLAQRGPCGTRSVLCCRQQGLGVLYNTSRSMVCFDLQKVQACKLRAEQLKTT